MQETVPRRTVREILADKNWDNWLETIGVVLLAVASFTAAWSGYQAAEWGAKQSTLYSLASSTRTEANQMRTDANLLALEDIEAFDNYVNAYAVNNTDLMQFFERRFSERLRPAVTAWIALDPLNSPDAPADPFAMDQYQIPESAVAKNLSAKADELFSEGSRAGDQSTQFVLNTVYLATVLFFAGIATKIKGRAARTVLIGLGLILLIYGIVHVADLQMS